MAAAVLALGIVGMIQAVISGTEMMDVARKQTIAMQIIRGQIEHVRVMTWNDVGRFAATKTVSVEQGDDASSDFIFGTNLPGISKNFQCTRTVATVRPDLKQVTYTVTWRGAGGRTYTRSSSTYVAKNGLYVTYQRS